MLDAVAVWVARVVEALGYPGLTALVALENLFPAIPSEVILPLAGFLTGQGRFTFWHVLFATTCGSLLGALALYGVGAAVGPARLERFVVRFGPWALVTPADLRRAEAWFDRYGALAVFMGRLAPVIRSLVSLPAGYRRMPLGRFLLLTACGSALWNGALVTFGWALGENWRLIERYVGWLQSAVIAMVAFAAVRFFWRRWSARGTLRL